MESERGSATLPTNGREHRIIVAGFGGQGVLTLGKVLCTAAMSEGKTVTYLPSYGAEVRGGTANCQVVISNDTVYSPLVERADSLIIMNQLSYDKFAGRVKPQGLLLVNSSVIELDEVPVEGPATVLALPATEMAAEMGNVKIANVILLSAFVTMTHLVGQESCTAALEGLLGERKASLMDLNMQAMRRGVDLAASTQTQPLPVSGAPAGKTT